MAFESLTDRLAGVFKKLRGHGKLSEADIKAAMSDNAEQHAGGCAYGRGFRAG